jgi:carbon storage regulator
MLVLTRKMNEEIVIDGRIRVRVLSVTGSRIRLGIEAPRSVAVQRSELVADADAAWAGSRDDQAPVALAAVG